MPVARGTDAPVAGRRPVVFAGLVPRNRSGARAADLRQGRHDRDQRG